MARRALDIHKQTDNRCTPRTRELVMVVMVILLYTNLATELLAEQDVPCCQVPVDKPSP